jgi:hypothetical protein
MLYFKSFLALGLNNSWKRHLMIDYLFKYSTFYTFLSLVIRYTYGRRSTEWICLQTRLLGRCICEEGCYGVLVRQYGTFNGKRIGVLVSLDFLN